MTWDKVLAQWNEDRQVLLDEIARLTAENERLRREWAEENERRRTGGGE